MAELKLVSYNLQNGTRQGALVANIRSFAAAGADIFCLQEVRPPEQAGFIGDDILKALGPDWAGKFFLSPKPENFDFGVGIIWRQSKLHVKASENLPLPRLPHWTWWERYTETFLTGQREPFQRGSLIVSFEVGGRTIRVANVHMDWAGGVAHRLGQLRHILDYLHQLPPADGEIICGDFNTIGFLDNTAQMKEINAALGEQFVSSFPTFQRTTTHFQHLDHIFVRNLQIKEAAVHPLPGSDHYPIVAAISTQ